MKRFVLSGLVGVFLCGVVGFGGVVQASSGNVPSLADALRSQNFQIQYELRRMGLSPEAARQAVWGAAYKPDSACSEHVHQLSDDYETLHPRGGEPPPTEDAVRMANTNDGQYVEDIELGHYCDRRVLDREEKEKRLLVQRVAREEQNPDHNPVLVVQRMFRNDRQEGIDRLVKAGVDPIVAENASRLVLSQQGRFEECAEHIDGFLKLDAYLQPDPATSWLLKPRYLEERDHASYVDGRDKHTDESVCDIARMYQLPDVEDPYQPSIDRLIKAFKDDRKGTIKKIVKAGVKRYRAKGAAKLVLAQKGRYRDCAVIMGALLDNLGDGGDVAQHVRAINGNIYLDSSDGGAEGICDDQNMVEDPSDTAVQLSE